MMVNMDKVKKLLSFIKEDWQRYENLPEHRILQKYSVHGRLFVLLYGEMIKDSKNRKNLTDLRLLFPMEYNVDHGKYYHSIIAHSYCITLLTVISIVAAESFFIIVIQHSVILFTIIGFQMKTAHVLDERILYRGDQWKAPTATKFSAQEEILVYRKIVRSIVEHNRALEYVSLVQSTFSTAIFFQIFFNVVCMSVSAVEILMSAADLDVVLGMLLWLVGQEMHLFFLCLSGQRITDSCENVYNDAIECLWYTFFAKSKVIYRFLIMNIATPRQLVAMKLLVLNMQTFQAVRTRRILRVAKPVANKPNFFQRFIVLSLPTHHFHRISLILQVCSRMRDTSSHFTLIPPLEQFAPTYSAMNSCVAIINCKSFSAKPFSR
ncbi:uncharacterized protein LOC116434714 isoform X2 [Nomia melanderi]|uniref:uncharacterized protein LOC116434714 isoform X2 n=1 Tax=Nomia melanderi TaxID=2448451 RepID=UPI003FCEC379